MFEVVSQAARSVKLFFMADEEFEESVSHAPLVEADSPGHQPPKTKLLLHVASGLVSAGARVTVLRLLFSQHNSSSSTTQLPTPVKQCCCRSQ